MEKINQPEGDRNEITSEAITNEYNHHEQQGQPVAGPAIIEETASPAEPPTTYAEAVGHSPYELLRELHDHSLGRFEAEQRRNDPNLHLAELALSSAVIWWWNHWQPIMMHRALKAGAGLGEVAAAAGVEESAAYQRWSAWAARQTQLVIGDRRGLDPAEVEAIRERIGRIAADAPADQP